MKKLLYILFHRSVFVGLSLIAQVVALMLMVGFFSEHTTGLYWFFIFLSVAAALLIVGSRMEPAYKIAWLLLVLPFPVFGGIFYLLVGGGQIPQRTSRRMKRIAEQSEENLREDFKADDLLTLGEDAAGQARYLEDFAHCPAYTNTETEYFPVGDLVFPRMLEELRKAERYIFLEYFIIAARRLLGQCAGDPGGEGGPGGGGAPDLRRHGLHVHPAPGLQRADGRPGHPVPGVQPLRAGDVPALEQPGPPEVPASSTARPPLPAASIWRTSISTGRSASATGRTAPSCWRGTRCGRMTVMFLTMWDHCLRLGGGVPPLPPGARSRPALDADTSSPTPTPPWTRSAVGQAVYLNMIGKARKYIYITTPYLIIDVATNTALCNAAKSGVDVRIITPHIPGQALCVRGDPGPLPAPAGGGGADL